MPRHPRRYPLSSFGPELMAALIKGTNERVELPCDNQRSMRALQARFNLLRAAMRHEGHGQAALVMRARISRTWKPGEPDTNCVLVIQPQDAQFEPTFKKAGIKATEHDRDILADFKDSDGANAPSDSPSIDPYAQYKDDKP